MDDQLRRRSVGSPAARSLLLTVLGEFALPRSQPVWQETLVSAMTTLGYTEYAARQALARSARDGWLTTERHGRRARMALTPQAENLLQTGADRIYSFGRRWEWDGRWLVVVLRVPEQQREVRNQLRTRLAWAGLGSLGGGVWVTPHIEREAELAAAIQEETAAEATSFIASLGSLGSAESIAATAWNVGGVSEQYAQFVADFRQTEPASPEACFRAQTLLVHAWRKFPFLDPDLPAELLPDRWPRERAHELFADRRSRWQGPARAYVDSLEAGLSSQAAAAA